MTLTPTEAAELGAATKKTQDLFAELDKIDFSTTWSEIVTLTKKFAAEHGPDVAKGIMNLALKGALAAAML